MRSSLRFYEFLKQKQNLGKEKSFTLNLRLRRSVQCFASLTLNIKKSNDLKKICDWTSTQRNQRTNRFKHHRYPILKKKGRSIHSVYITQPTKTASKTPKKIAILAFLSKKTVEIPTNTVKQPENAKQDDLQHRASKITGLIMSNRLSDRFKQGDESIMQMMARIKVRSQPMQ